MSGNREGSVLIFALAAVTIMSLLAIGLSIWLRPKLALIAQLNTARYESKCCYDAIQDFANEVLLSDTNGFDSTREVWCRPYISEANLDVTIQSEHTTQDSEELQGANDEESKLPLNLETTGPLEELLTLTIGCTRDNAAAIVKEIDALRPLLCVEQLKMVSSLSEDEYQKLIPYVTVMPIQGININTASEIVLKSLFSEAKKYDAKAAMTLSARILAYRQSGQAFTSVEQSHINSELNGLSQAELLLIGAAKEKIVVESRYISAKATAKSTAIHFTFDRLEKKLVRTVFARQ